MMRAPALLAPLLAVLITLSLAACDPVAEPEPAPAPESTEAGSGY